jgi:hypothetical protein
MSTGKRFRYDICRVVGHETDENSVVCTRCEYNIFAKHLEERLANQFIGRKVTADLPYYIRDSTAALLNEEIMAGEVLDYKNIEVRAHIVGQLCITFDVRIPISPLYYHMEIIL